MNKLNRTDKSELIKLASISSASQIAFKNNIRAEVVYYIYKKHNIQNLLKYSPRFIKAFHRKGGLSNNQICVELGITYKYLLKVATSEKVSTCRFKKANEICKKIGYKGSIDYIEKNGVFEFRKNIKPQII
jgi:DNA-binding Xre family transcriptional regulator